MAENPFATVDYAVLQQALGQTFPEVPIQAVGKMGPEGQRTLIHKINEIGRENFRESPCLEGGKHNISVQQFYDLNDPNRPPGHEHEYDSCDNCGQCYWPIYPLIK